MLRRGFGSLQPVSILTNQLHELKRLKAEGKIAAFGLGVNETQVCVDIMKQVPLDVILIAGRLSLLDRSAEVEASEAGLSIAEAALQFAMNHPSATSVLLGTGDSKILQLNLDAANKTMSKAAMDLISHFS